jgi:hypothetical protein
MMFFALKIGRLGACKTGPFDKKGIPLTGVTTISGTSSFSRATQMKIYHRGIETPRMLEALRRVRQTHRRQSSFDKAQDSSGQARGEISRNAALLPLYSSKRGCGNFGHGISGTEIPATFSSRCLCVSSRTRRVVNPLALQVAVTPVKEIPLLNNKEKGV